MRFSGTSGVRQSSEVTARATYPNGRNGNDWRDHHDMPTTAQAAIGRATIVRIM
jgi:hypothetical protein